MASATEGEAALTSLKLTGLTEIGGTLTIRKQTQLVEWEMPELTTIGKFLLVQDNSKLKSIPLPSLVSVDKGPGGPEGTCGEECSLYFSKNAALPECLIDALVEQLQAVSGIGGGVLSKNNLDSCTCKEVDGKTVATCP